MTLSLWQLSVLSSQYCHCYCCNLHPPSSSHSLSPVASRNPHNGASDRDHWERSRETQNRMGNTKLNISIVFVVIVWSQNSLSLPSIYEDLFLKYQTLWCLLFKFPTIHHFIELWPFNSLQTNAHLLTLDRMENVIKVFL